MAYPDVTGATCPQLRSSCDLCNSAKVKCSKTRPKCGRCEARGTDCVYSVSLRSVKRKRGLGKQHSRSPSNALNTPASTLDDFVDFDPSAADMVLQPPSMDDWNVNFDMPLFNSPDLTPVSTTSSFSFASFRPSPTASTCQCEQVITKKLAELSATDLRLADLPFDTFLTSSKAVMAVCTSSINCSATNHKEDLQLALVFSALLLHLVGMYESKLAATSRSHHLAASTQVRLSLGSYQFDYQDAQIMEANLIHLELSKIRNLVDSFEQRFCRQTPSSPDPEHDFVDPISPLVGRVRRKLHCNFETVRACVTFPDAAGQR